MQNTFADKPENGDIHDSSVGNQAADRQSNPARSVTYEQTQSYNLGEVAHRYARSFAPPLQPRHFRKKPNTT